MSELSTEELIAQKQSWLTQDVSNLKVDIVFSDMDETFLHTDKSLDDNNMAMLDRLAELGIPFVPCSGRAFNVLPKEVVNHPASKYVVSCDGAVIRDLSTQTVLHESTVTKEQALELYQKLKDYPVTFDIFADGGVYLERSRHNLITQLGIPADHAAFMQRSRTPFDQSVEEFIEGVTTIERLGSYWSVAEGEKYQALVADAVASVKGLSGTASMSMGMEILADGTSKGAALQWLCNHLGISTDNAAAFGDSLNDVAMLSAAGMGTAVANARREDFEVAAYITLTNDEAGFSRFLTWALGE